MDKRAVEKKIRKILQQQEKIYDLVQEVENRLDESHGTIHQLIKLLDIDE